MGHNISINTGNQTMTFSQLIKENVKNIFFFRNYAGNEVGRLVPERFSFLKKDLSKIKESDQHL